MSCSAVSPAAKRVGGKVMQREDENVKKFAGKEREWEWVCSLFEWLQWVACIRFIRPGDERRPVLCGLGYCSRQRRRRGGLLKDHSHTPPPLTCPVATSLARLSTISTIYCMSLLFFILGPIWGTPVFKTGHQTWASKSVRSVRSRWKQMISPTVHCDLIRCLLMATLYVNPKCNKAWNMHWTSFSVFYMSSDSWAWRTALLLRNVRFIALATNCVQISKRLKWHSTRFDWVVMLDVSMGKSTPVGFPATSSGPLDMSTNPLDTNCFKKVKAIDQLVGMMPQVCWTKDTIVIDQPVCRATGKNKRPLGATECCQ